MVMTVRWKKYIWKLIEREGGAGGNVGMVLGGLARLSGRWGVARWVEPGIFSGVARA